MNMKMKVQMDRKWKGYETENHMKRERTIRKIKVKMKLA